MHILLKWVLLWSYGWLLYALIIRELIVTSYWTCNAIQGTLFIWFAVSFIVNAFGIALHPIFAHNNSKTTKCGQ